MLVASREMQHRLSLRLLFPLIQNVTTCAFCGPYPVVRCHSGPSPPSELNAEVTRLCEAHLLEQLQHCDVRSVLSDVRVESTLSGECEHARSVAAPAPSSLAVLGDHSVRNVTSDAVSDVVPAPVRDESVREHVSTCYVAACGVDGGAPSVPPEARQSRSVPEPSQTRHCATCECQLRMPVHFHA